MDVMCSFFLLVSLFHRLPPMTIVLTVIHMQVLTYRLASTASQSSTVRSPSSHLPLHPFPPKTQWLRDDALDRLVRQPWRSRTVIHIPASSSRNFSDRGFGRRAGRLADYSSEKWMQVDESSPPFLPSLGGLSFPLFAPSLAGDASRGRMGLRGPQYPPSLDYDRPSGPSAAPADGLSRLPSNSYYDSPKNGPSSAPPAGGMAPRGYSGPPPERQRYSRPEKNQYSPYGPGGPAGAPKVRGKGNNYGPPAEPFYPDYDDGVPRYSYNPSETPKCAKDTNVSYCIEDTEYPM